MTTLTAGKTYSDSLQKGFRLTVTMDAVSTAIVQRIYSDIVLEEVSLAASKTRIFGEYEAEMQFKIICFTGSLTYTETQSTSQVLVRATQTNDDAAAGEIGEYLTATVAIGDAVALTTNTETDIVTLALTAGDWDVDGVVGYVPTASTSMTHISEGISTTSATMGGIGTQIGHTFPAIVPGTDHEWAQATPTVRISIAATTTIYLVSHTLFTVSTLAAYGFLRARRVR